VASGAIGGAKPIPVAPSAEISLLRPLSSGFQAAEKTLVDRASTETALAEQKAANSSLKTTAKKPVAPGYVEYSAPMPRKLRSGPWEDQVKWLDENATLEHKMATSNHELAHYVYAQKAGIPSDDLALFLGHSPDGSGEYDLGSVLTPGRFWKDQMSADKTPLQKQQAAHNYLKQSYAPEIIEKRHGGTPESIAVATASDRADAEDFMENVMGLNKQQRQQTRAKLLKQLDKEIDPKFMAKLNKASQELITHHWGNDNYPESDWVDHYLNGGTRDKISDKIQTVYEQREARKAFNLASYEKKGK
jgi:hypothetical protein